MQQLAGTRLNAIIVSICFVTAAFRHSGVSSQRRPHYKTGRSCAL
jgi:hypothetical protein